MDRNDLKGKNGDRFHVKMAAIGFNFRRILAWMKDILCQILTSLWSPKGAQGGIYKPIIAACEYLAEKYQKHQNTPLVNVGLAQGIELNKTENNLAMPVQHVRGYSVLGCSTRA